MCSSIKSLLSIESPPVWFGWRRRSSVRKYIRKRARLCLSVTTNWRGKTYDGDGRWSGHVRPPSRIMLIVAVILWFLCNYSTASRVVGGRRLAFAAWRRPLPEPVFYYTPNTIIQTHRRTKKWLLAAEVDSITAGIVDKLSSSLEFKQRADSNVDAHSRPMKASLPEDTPSSAFNPIHESLANEYYQKRNDSTGEENTRLESTDAHSPTPSTNVMVPRRRFADFGIASERAEPIDGELSTQEYESIVSSSDDDSSNTIKLKGFSESGRSQSWNLKKNGIPFTDEETTPSASAAIIKEQRPTRSTAVVSQQTPTLINTQPLSPPNDLPISKSGLDIDIDTFGNPVIIFGVTLSLLLGIYLKQISENTKFARRSVQRNVHADDKEFGFFGNITNETKNLLQRIKDAGTAGAISYALWEAAFWGVSLPVCLVSYRQVTGHWPDLTSGDDLKKLGLEAFAFVNVARFAVPIRIGLALSTVPWVTEKILPIFSRSNENKDGNSASEDELSPQVIPDEKQIPNEVADKSFVPTTTLSSPIDDVEADESSGISQVESRLRQIETDAMRLSTMSPESMTSWVDRTPLRELNIDTGSFSNIYDYCEPGQMNSACSESIKGYLDSLARTGAIATDGEVKIIVRYLDSLSSNVMPKNRNRGAAFTNYLDALSMGSIPAPTSAMAVANYLDVLSKEPTTRINEVEERLSRLESSIASLPDEIASRLATWQMNQDKKMNDDMETIMKLLVDVKSKDE